MTRLRGEGGFSLVEMLVATAIVCGAFALVFQFTASAQRAARAVPDASDMQQRLRVAADAIRRDLLGAGAGFVHGTGGGPLVDYLPPISPMRLGARKPDPELSFFTDRITILSLPDDGAVARPAVDMTGPAAGIAIDPAAAGCPAAGLCGFAPGTRSVIVDTSGPGRGYELFSVTDTAAGLAHGAPDPVFSKPYAAASSRVAEVRQRTYYLDDGTRRLMSYDGYRTDVPLAENVVLLRFEYFVDASPSAAPRPPDGEESCAYAAGSPSTPVLADLGAPLLATATAALLTDGPACGISPFRFDADLFRIRRVRVTIRAQVSSSALRGTGSDFTNAGRASGGWSYVPDIQVSFDVTPRNMVPSR
jgi:prepilin-type N-terminal cleavage/methylation domain-containing protein